MRSTSSSSTQSRGTSGSGSTRPSRPSRSTSWRSSDNYNMSFWKKMTTLFVPHSIPRVTSNIFSSFADAFFYISVSEVFTAGAATANLCPGGTCSTFGIGTLITQYTASGNYVEVYYCLISIAVAVIAVTAGAFAPQQVGHRQVRSRHARRDKAARGEVARQACDQPLARLPQPDERLQRLRVEAEADPARRTDPRPGASGEGEGREVCRDIGRASPCWPCSSTRPRRLLLRFRPRPGTGSSGRPRSSSSTSERTTSA